MSKQERLEEFIVDCGCDIIDHILSTAYCPSVSEAGVNFQPEVEEIRDCLDVLGIHLECEGVDGVSLNHLAEEVLEMFMEVIIDDRVKIIYYDDGYSTHPSEKSLGLLQEQFKKFIMGYIKVIQEQEDDSPTRTVQVNSTLTPSTAQERDDWVSFQSYNTLNNLGPRLEDIPTIIDNYFQTKPKEETTMVTIKHHITIDGKDATSYSDEDILHIIRQLEDKAKQLAEMKTMAAKKESILKEIHARIDELVKIIDNR